ncbi:MAG: hypothetical protein HQ554_03670 [FCB group bacterium]|nr:hypothetical protein [FCB group bacterium]
MKETLSRFSTIRLTREFQHRLATQADVPSARLTTLWQSLNFFLLLDRRRWLSKAKSVEVDANPQDFSFNFHF